MQLLKPYVTLVFSVMIKRFVRQRLFLFCFSLPLLLAVSSVAPTQSFAVRLPEIEAHQFQSIPLRMSKSGRVYLFQTTSANDLPKTGNLVLFQERNKPSMAFRVLKTDPTKSEYVGKRVRRYDQTGVLKMNEKYFSIEKVSDLLALPAPDLRPAATPVPAPLPVMTPVPADPEADPSVTDPSANPTDADLDAPANGQTTRKKAPETDLEVFDYDDDLDSSTSPRNLKRESQGKVIHSDQSDDEDSSERSVFEIDETQRIDPYKNSIMFGAGFFKNMSNFKFAGGTHNGILATYARTLKNDVYVASKSIQDSTSLEFGLGYYTEINMTGKNDVYKVVPIIAEFHYNLTFSQTFGAYIYGGIQYNSLLSTENVNALSDADTIDKMRGIQHTFGVGLLYNMGPQWYLRLNLGWDRITAGLAIKW